MPEYQCAVKREAKKAQKEKDRPNNAIGSPESKDADVKVPQQQHHHQPQQLQQQQQQALAKGSRDSFAPASAADSRRAAHHRQVLDDKSMSSSSSGTNGLVIKPLSPEQEELINRLVYFQEEFDQPSEEDLRKISVRRAPLYQFELVQVVSNVPFV